LLSDVFRKKNNPALSHITLVAHEKLAFTTHQNFSISASLDRHETLFRSRIKIQPVCPHVDIYGQRLHEIRVTLYLSLRKQRHKKKSTKTKKKRRLSFCLLLHPSFKSSDAPQTALHR
jgi:hypothetical protein